MHIGILQTGHSPDVIRNRLGDVDQLFRDLLEPNGFNCTTWAVVDGDFPPSPESADGWVITGSRHGVYEDHAWIAPLEQFVRDTVQAKVPMVGICFGHQIMAQALGGRVEKFNGGWTVGAQNYSFGDDDFLLAAWHQDQVVDLPAGAQVVSQTDTCAFAALSYGDHAYSVQFHPEFDSAFLRELVEHRGPGVVPELRLEKARRDLALTLDGKRFGEKMAAFFRAGAHG
ncbi:MAG: type 1 glutamine amidotransferase [Pseudomonadota bacterium]